MNFNILIVDGGGIRGYYTSSLLEHLNKLINPNYKCYLKQNLNLVSGTSTGSLIVSGIVNDIPLENISKYYHDNGKDIFQVNLSKGWGFVKAFFKNKSQSLRGKQALVQVVDNIIGDITLSEVYNDSNIAMCIPAIAKSSGQPYIFKTPHLKRLTRDLEVKLKDACLASSSAPFYFPPHDINGQYFIDGGLCCNNPIAIALLEAIEIIEEKKLDVTKINILHIDTLRKSFNDLKDTTWKLTNIADVIDISMLSGDKLNDYLALFIQKHIKYNVEIKNIHPRPLSETENKKIQMDNCDDDVMQMMKNIAKETAEKTYGDYSNGRDFEILKDFMENNNV